MFVIMIDDFNYFSFIVDVCIVIVYDLDILMLDLGFEGNFVGVGRKGRGKEE